MLDAKTLETAAVPEKQKQAAVLEVTLGSRAHVALRAPAAENEGCWWLKANEEQVHEGDGCRVPRQEVPPREAGSEVRALHRIVVVDLLKPIEAEEAVAQKDWCDEEPSKNASHEEAQPLDAAAEAGPERQRAQGELRDEHVVRMAMNHLKGVFYYPTPNGYLEPKRQVDTIARLETQAIDTYNDAHHYCAENTLTHLHEQKNLEEKKAKNAAIVAGETGAQATVESAIKGLKDFYGDPKGAALLQSVNQAAFLAQGMRAASKEPYTGMSSESGSMSGMLEVILSYFARLQAETTYTSS